MFLQKPEERLTLNGAKNHPWVTDDGAYRMPSTEENCHLVEVTDAEIEIAITCMKWGTMVSLCYGNLLL